MSRTTHDVVNDHFGRLSETQIASGTPTATYVPIASGTGTAAWGAQSGGGSSVHLENDDTTLASDGVVFKDGANYLGSEGNTASDESAYLLISSGADDIELYVQSANDTFSLVDAWAPLPAVDIYAQEGSTTADCFVDGHNGVVDLSTLQSSVTTRLILEDGVVSMASTALAFIPPKRSSDPGSPVEGWVYYNTATHKLRVYNGTIWENCN